MVWNQPNKTSVLKTIDALNSDQRRIFEPVRNHFTKHPDEPLRMFITGGAGSGKSFLLKTADHYLIFAIKNIQWLLLI